MEASVELKQDCELGRGLGLLAQLCHKLCDFQFPACEIKSVVPKWNSMH